MFMVIPPYLTYAEHNELLWLWNVLYPLTHVTDSLYGTAISQSLPDRKDPA